MKPKRIAAAMLAAANLLGVASGAELAERKTLALDGARHRLPPPWPMHTETTPDSNGLTVDRYGRPTINEHGNRRVTRIEPDGSVRVLADRHDGKLQFVAKDLTGPDRIAFSPDEIHLYVANWDEKKKVVMRYEAHPDGAESNGQVCFDMTGAPGENALDGVKVDERGSLYVSGPGGLWILPPEAKNLGTIVAPKHPHDVAWGDEDGKTLYACARSDVYKMRLQVAGIMPTRRTRK